MTNINEIVTHSGPFHADDVFAVATLLLISPNARVIRTRDPQLFAPFVGRVVVDVGGVYDPAQNLYDHHQRDGRRPPRENGIPFSSFGLVWAHFAGDVLATLSTQTVDFSHLEAAIAVDKRLVSGIDATDCGVHLSELKPEYQGCGLGLSSAIAQMNPSWLYGTDGDAEFRLAVQVAQQLLIGHVRAVIGEFAAKAQVAKELRERPSPRTLTLSRFMPWQETVVSDEKVLYVLFEETRGTWMVQAVPTAIGSFSNRKPLPEKWAGLRDSEFANETGVEDAIFCHPNRFICGARTKEGAVRLAELALAE